MSQIIEAVFESGAFRVLDKVKLPFLEGQQVRLIIELPSETPEDLLNLAAEVYEGLSKEEIDEIEHIALDRHDFFGEEVQV